MLNRIIILNSTTYGKAAIRFNDADSIQVIGPNNVGKSTLVFALNFLFIIDGKRMSFIDNKPGDKDTIHHYFPSYTDSYVIFEIYKQRYYCILLKRNNDGELEYYRIDNEYKDELFIKNQENRQVILKFEEMYSRLITSGITIEGFKDKREVFNFVYQRGRRNNGVVWLENAVITDGLSNNFSKIYRYLINSKLINNKTLKEALIVADSRDGQTLNFSQKSRKDINDLLRINNDIKSISSIQKEFTEFRELVNQHRARTKILSELLFAFNIQYPSILADLELRYFQKKKEIELVQNELHELIPRKQKLDREIGGMQTELSKIVETQNRIQSKLNEIDSYEGLDFLNQAFLNLDDKRRILEASITRTEVISVKQIENKISELKSTSNALENQINGYSNQLIHKISSKQSDKEIVNGILSNEFSSLSSELIEKPVDSIGQTMMFFDGRITLPKNFKSKPIPSIEELSEKLVLLRKELKEFEELLPVAQNSENARTELKNLNSEISAIKQKIQLIESVPSLKEELTKLKELFAKTSSTKHQIEKDLALLSEDIDRKSASIPMITEARKTLESEISELKRWKVETEKIELEPNSIETTDTLAQIYSKITVTVSDRSELKTKKDAVFNSLKQRIRSQEADENLFIKFVEEEIACLSEKQKSVETILHAISTQFANPAYLLLKRFHEFKEFVTNKFNTKLSRIKISDIESLKIVLHETTRIIDDLKRISAIQEIQPQINFDFDYSENLKTLNAYLDSGRKIEFEELFDIELHLTKDGKERTVDLKEQVESTGTDIMIRMVIIASVINKLAINDPSNRVPIAIDEIARVDGPNRYELLKFCKEHNLIPICTSTEETALPGFGKHIMLYRPHSKGGKVNISEGSPNVIKNEPIESHERA
ncbi:MAG TPA: hypothetical protein PKL56_11825 [Cyclobacteriaceae bacterium]|nr:hypothetical protein [Cyclobacteriaceae bacterium]HMV07482.1 hypothetical protein [Cyclobacteriaceae bacterium]HMW99163.1 hypothetical protein [Cyclobacteriaceae bacterium]HMX48204.1 hypothetical protein [Cyclobacteriaceae bacterium]HMY95009.1 hypothetical protein [Cyclobacteriaceae bacterium]